jgi:hypothetical protein
VSGSLCFYYPEDTKEAEDSGSDRASSEKTLKFILKDRQRFEVEMFAIDDEDCPFPDAWDYIPTSQRTASRSNSAEALAIMKS